MDVQELSLRIRERLNELGATQHAIERSAGLPPDAIRNVLRGSEKDGPRLRRLSQIADALDLELYFGPRRADPAPGAGELPGDDFVPVRRLDLALSAGAGAEPVEGPPQAVVAFRRDWLARIGLAPGDGVVVSVRGDSMVPTLHDGDLVLIDRRRCTPRPGRAYALTDIDDMLKVKRVDADPGAGVLLIRSDNPAEPALLRSGPDAARVLIHGEVVWSGHCWR